MTPTDLAKVILKKMGEDNYDLGSLPSDTRPECLWDFTLPAEALAKLCDELGFIVVLGLDDTVKLCQVGVGADLPEGFDVLTNSLSMDVWSAPDSIAIVSAKIRFQEDFQLEAVGIEQGSTPKLVPIDQLSYTPAGGWGNEDPDDFPSLMATSLSNHDLAMRSVFRYYRIVFPCQIHGYSDSQGNKDATLTDYWKLHLEPQQVETVTDQPANVPQEQKRAKPAAVYGNYFSELEDITKSMATVGGVDPTNADQEVNHVHFYIDEKQCVVIFSEPIYLYDESAQTYSAAKLWLRTACTILDEQLFSPVRMYYSWQTGNQLGTDTRFDIFEDVQPQIVAHYSKGSTDTINYQNTTDNQQDAQQQAKYYWDAIVQSYAQKTPQTVTYGSLRYVDLDGAIQHVTWSVGKDGPKTTACRNNERRTLVQSKDERRLIERMKERLRDDTASEKTRAWKEHRHWR
jgi:hypothetical protein